MKRSRRSRPRSSPRWPSAPAARCGPDASPYIPAIFPNMRDIGRSFKPCFAFRPMPRLEPRDDLRPNPSEGLAPDEHREMLQAHAHFPGILNDARVLNRHLIDE